MLSRAKSFTRRLLPKNAFARGVSVLVGGTAGAQILLILASPLLTRLYTPEDFGLLAVYASLLALVGVVSSLRYELAIPLPEDDQEAANVAVLCLVLVAISSVLTAIVIIFLGGSIASALGVPRLDNYLWLLPLGVFISGTYTVFNYWSIRTKRFSTIAATKVRQAIATLLIQLTFFKLGGITLLFGQIAGQGVGTTSLALPALAQPEFKKTKIIDARDVAFKYRQFPFFSTWAGLLNTLGAQLPVLLFSSLFSPITAGLYLLANRIIFSPTLILQDAIGKVLFSSKNDHNPDAYSLLITKTHKILLLISSPIAAFIFLYSPDFFPYIFGEEWTDAGHYAQYLSIMFLFQFASSPLTVVFHSLHRPDLTLTYNIILFVFRIIGILVGYIYNSVSLSVLFFSLFSSIGYILFAFGTTRLAGVSLKIFLYNNLIGILSGATIMTTPYFCYHILDLNFISFIIGILLLVFYFLLLKKFNEKNT